MSNRTPTNAQRRILKGLRVGFEQSSILFDSFAIPYIRKYQDKASRKALNVANKATELLGEPRKTYIRINQKGQVEHVT